MNNILGIAIIAIIFTILFIFLIRRKNNGPEQSLDKDYNDQEVKKEEELDEDIENSKHHPHSEPQIETLEQSKHRLSSISNPDINKPFSRISVPSEVEIAIIKNRSILANEEMIEIIPGIHEIISKTDHLETDDIEEKEILNTPKKEVNKRKHNKKPKTNKDEDNKEEQRA